MQYYYRRDLQDEKGYKIVDGMYREGSNSSPSERDKNYIKSLFSITVVEKKHANFVQRFESRGILQTCFLNKVIFS